jgi:hypothetical protein
LALRRGVEDAPIQERIESKAGIDALHSFFLPRHVSLLGPAIFHNGCVLELTPQITFHQHFQRCETPRMILIFWNIPR